MRVSRTGIKVVAVLWSDASYERESDIEDLDKHCDLCTVGQLIDEDETHVSIALERYVGIERYRHIAHIPKVNIKQIQKVKIRGWE